MKKALSLLALCALAAPAWASDDLRTVPLFRHGTVAAAVGVGNLVPADLDRDGVREIVTCDAGAPFALIPNGTPTQYPWYGPTVNCRAAGVGDGDGDGLLEVYAVTYSPGMSMPGQLLVFDPRTLGGPRATVTLPGTTGGQDLAVGNVDNDPAPEIVVTTLDATYVYDGATLALQWNANGFGGKEVEIADVDGGAAKEIVVNGSTGYVLDGAANVMKWGYIGGFGYSMTLGNVDGDAKIEICWSSGSYYTPEVTIFNADTFEAAKMPLPANLSVHAIAVGDGNYDGTNEIIVGGDYTITGRKPSDGSVLWSMQGAVGAHIQLDDLNGDGNSEVLWTQARWAGGDDTLLVGDPATGQTTFTSVEQDQPFTLAAADLTGDGRMEVIAASQESDFRYSPAVIEVFDLLTHASRGKLPMPNGLNFKASRVAVGQLDGDPQLEIVALGRNGTWYESLLVVWDGATLQQQWASTLPAWNAPQFVVPALLVANLDGDANDEIVIGQSDSKVLVLNGASNVVQHTETITGNVTDLALTDFGGDGVLDLVVGATNDLYVFNTSTWQSLGHAAIAKVNHVAATPLGVAVAYGQEYDEYGSLQYRSTAALTAAWNCENFPKIYTLAFATLDGAPRLLAGMSTGEVKHAPIGGSTCPAFETHAVTGAAGSGINSMELMDVTGDGRPELLLGLRFAAEVDLLGSAAFTRGDANESATVELSDLDEMRRFVYGGTLGTSASADFDADGRVGAEDIFKVISYLYAGGAVPQP